MTYTFKYLMHTYDMQLERRAQWKIVESQMSLNHAFQEADLEEQMILVVAQESYSKDFQD